MKNAKKITSILIIASITMVMLAGCSSKKSDTATTGTKGQFGNRNFDPATIKTRYEDALKPLVTAGTITQDQSDKVIAEVTKNMQQPGSQGSNGTGKPTGQQNSQQGQTKGTGTDTGTGAGQGNGTGTGAGNGQNRSRTNQLATLVTSGVITQAQADAITQKLGETMKNNQGTQPTTPATN